MKSVGKLRSTVVYTSVGPRPAASAAAAAAAADQSTVRRRYAWILLVTAAQLKIAAGAAALSLASAAAHYPQPRLSQPTASLPSPTRPSSLPTLMGSGWLSLLPSSARRSMRSDLGRRRRLPRPLRVARRAYWCGVGSVDPRYRLSRDGMPHSASATSAPNWAPGCKTIIIRLCTVPRRMCLTLLCCLS